MGDYDIREISIKDLTEKILIQGARNYLENFINGGGHWVVYPSSLEFVSAQEYFQTEDYIPLERLYSIAPGKLPVHPETGERAVYFHTYRTLYEIFRWKVTRPGCVFLILTDNRGDMKGMVFGNRFTLKSLIYWEGWEFALFYGSDQASAFDRRPEEYLNDINRSAKQYPEIFSTIVADTSIQFPISLDTEVFSNNCLCIHPDFRNSDAFPCLVEQYVSAFSAETQQLLMICETTKGSKVSSLYEDVGMIPNTLKLRHRSGEPVEAKGSESVITIGSYRQLATMSEQLCRFSRRKAS